MSAGRAPSGSSRKEARHPSPDGSGSAWLFAGTDSGFEATTNVYFTWIVATTLSASSAPPSAWRL